MEIVLAALVLILAAIPALLFLQNLRLYTRPSLPRGTIPPVSVLIPARNEEKTIGAAVASALANRGVVVEVLVLDDGSTDGTARVVESIAAIDPRVTLLRGYPLPEGWCGKQHACAVLARAARYPLLCFMDADVILTESALARMGAFLKSSGAALASGIPYQQTVTPLEQLLIPLIHFVLLGFLPVDRMRRSIHPAFAAGCGQLFFADAAAYGTAGGHASIRATLHDGLNLPRAFRRAGLKTDLFDATGIAACRMYHSSREVWNGLLKNAIEGLASPVRIVPVTLVLALGQIAPWFLVATTEGTSFSLSVAALCMSYVPRMSSIVRFRQPPLSALLHPLGVLALLMIQWHALFRHWIGRQAQWKGRNYGGVPPVEVR
jgi:glycosyltransferase involved in cell wall biosynthesis